MDRRTDAALAGGGLLMVLCCAVGPAVIGPVAARLATGALVSLTLALVAWLRPQGVALLAFVVLAMLAFAVGAGAERGAGDGPEDVDPEVDVARPGHVWARVAAAHRHHDVSSRR